MALKNVRYVKWKYKRFIYEEVQKKEENIKHRRGKCASIVK